VSETAVKDFYTASLDSLMKRRDKCINVGGGCVEKINVFPGSNIICFTFYVHF
jgi:hypothetical protein